MKLIAHRGNTEGPKKDSENQPIYIDFAIESGYDVEVDLRKFETGLYLGHDFPEFKVTEEWLHSRKDRLWIHCKNSDALEFCLEKDLHCFWHNIDDYTMTSKGYVWAFPGKENVGDKCVLVMPENDWPVEIIKKKAKFGVCSDYVKLLNT